MYSLRFKSDNYLYFYREGNLYNGKFWGIPKSEWLKWKNKEYPLKELMKVSFACSMDSSLDEVLSQVEFEWTKKLFPESRSISKEDSIQCVREFYSQVKPKVLEEYPSETHFGVLFQLGKYSEGILLDNSDGKLRYQLDYIDRGRFQIVFDKVNGGIINSSTLLEKPISIDEKKTMSYLEYEKSRTLLYSKYTNAVLLDLYVSKDNKTCISNLCYMTIYPEYFDMLMSYKDNTVAELTDFEEVVFM